MNTFEKIKFNSTNFRKWPLSTQAFIKEYEYLFSPILEDSDLEISDQLIFDEEKALLKFISSKNGDLFFDLEADLNYHRRKNYSLKKEPLAKALALVGNRDRRVWDTTCGTGKDLILMYAFGAKITAFERHPLIYLLLEDAIRRGNLEIELYYGDSLSLIESPLSKDKLNFPDVIYYDPMYPEKKKSALPRKEMQIFKTLVGPDSDCEEFLKRALNIALDRVVVKRSIHAPKIFDQTTASYEGKSTRYDMYKITK